MQKIRTMALAALSLGVGASGALAGTPVFNSSLSTATIIHDYDVDNFATPLFFTSPLTIQGSAPTVSTINSFTFGTASTKTNFGIGHYENTTSAKIVFASGSGVDQVDPDSLLHPSRVTVNFNFVWDIKSTKYGLPLTGPFSMPVGGTILFGGSAQADANVQWQASINNGGVINYPALRAPYVGTTGLMTNPSTSTFLTSLSAPTAAFSPTSIPYTPGVNRIFFNGSVSFTVNNDHQPTFMEIQYPPDVQHDAGVNMDMGGFEVDRPLIISDTFTMFNGFTVVGRQPDEVNLPGGYYVQKGPAGHQELQSGTAEIGPDLGVAVSIASEGAYTKPSAITIGCDLIPNGVVTLLGGTEGLGLGFYPDDSATTNAADGFTGLVMDPVSGELRLIVAGAYLGQSQAYPDIDPFSAVGDFDPAALHYLTYDVNTVTGAISNVLIDDLLVSFSTNAFTDAATNFAGFYSDPPPVAFARFDHFTVGETIDVSEVPEPASASLLALGALVVVRRRKK